MKTITLILLLIGTWNLELGTCTAQSWTNLDSLAQNPFKRPIGTPNIAAKITPASTASDNVTVALVLGPPAISNCVYSVDPVAGATNYIFQVVQPDAALNGFMGCYQSPSNTITIPMTADDYIESVTVTDGQSWSATDFAYGPFQTLTNTSLSTTEPVSNCWLSASTDLVHWQDLKPFTNGMSVSVQGNGYYALHGATNALLVLNQYQVTPCATSQGWLEP